MTLSSSAQRWLRAVLWTAAAGLAASAWSALRPGRALEERSVDFRFSVRGTEAAGGDVVLIARDEAAYQQVNVNPWPASAWVETIERLNEAGAAVVAFDTIYSEATQSCGPVNNDQAVAKAAADAGNVVWAYTLDPESKEAIPLIPPVRAAVAGAGYANLAGSEDAVVRNVYPRIGKERCFAAAVYEAFTGTPPPGPWQSKELQRIPFLGPAGTIPTISLSEVLQGSFSPGAFEGKICIVADTTIAGHDAFQTPIRDPAEKDMPGGEIHAQILEAMLRNRTLRPAPAGREWLLAGLGALIVAILLFQDHLAIAAVVHAMLLGGFAFWSQQRFASAGEVTPFSGPLIWMVAGFWSSVLAAHLAERKRRRQIRSLVENYLDPKVVSWLLKNPDRLHTAGVRRMVTVLDTDIEGFTTITHSIPPEQLVAQLNEYFEAVTEAAIGAGGMHDKFVGDALMMIYGFPLDEPDHAERAVRAAQDILRRVDALNARWAAVGKPQFKTRIGICSGEVVMGSVGGTRRKAVTAMGDAANLASRLEGANKRFGTRVLLAESTARLLSEDIPLRDLGLVELRGMADQIRVFNPAFDHPPDPPPGRPDGEPERRAQGV